MALTFYTVRTDKRGYPVKFVRPSTPGSNGVLYENVQTFFDSKNPFGDPGEASQEFKAWLGPAVEVCYLDEVAFRGKVKALPQMRRDLEKMLNKWNAMAAGGNV